MSNPPGEGKQQAPADEEGDYASHGPQAGETRSHQVRSVFDAALKLQVNEHGA